MFRSTEDPTTHRLPIAGVEDKVLGKGGGQQAPDAVGVQLQGPANALDQLPGLGDDVGARVAHNAGLGFEGRSVRGRKVIGEEFKGFIPGQMPCQLIESLNVRNVPFLLKMARVINKCGTHHFHGEPAGAFAHHVAVEGVEDALVGHLQRVVEDHTAAGQLLARQVVGGHRLGCCFCFLKNK